MAPDTPNPETKQDVDNLEAKPDLFSLESIPDVVNLEAILDLVNPEAIPEPANPEKTAGLVLTSNQTMKANLYWNGRNQEQSEAIPNI